MKNIIIIALIVVSLIVVGFFFFQREEIDFKEDQTEEDIVQEEREIPSDYLDMREYHLYPPEDYDCEGGFVGGNEYLDAECIPKDRSDYVINIGVGLQSASIDWNEGKLVGERILRKGFEITGEQNGEMVCEEFYSEDLELDAEHYLCRHLEDEDYMITIGVGKSFYIPDGSYGGWFEVDLVIKEENDDYEESDYIGELVKFLNEAIKINWDDYAPNY